jgi:hypothetical protein
LVDTRCKQDRRALENRRRQSDQEATKATKRLRAGLPDPVSTFTPDWDHLDRPPR